MDRQELIQQIKRKKSFLCIGLDSDIDKIPEAVKKESDDPVFAFNRKIVDATIDLAVAYKPNVAFYESLGSKGWRSLEKTIHYIAEHPQGPVFTIADAKRADIGNSSRHYARAFFETMPFDAVTVNPYMGYDSLQPFFAYEGKWTIVLALTSNPGATDYQMLQPQLPMLLDKLGIKSCHWNKLYEVVMDKCMTLGTADNTMFVAGATQPEHIGAIRDRAPGHFLLIPGVGSQGGDLQTLADIAMNRDVGILVNSSRSIIFASSDADFAEKARQAAHTMQKQMEGFL